MIDQYCPAWRARSVGLTTDKERDEHALRFSSGEALFNVENGAFITFRQYGEDWCRVRIHPQGGHHFAKIISRHDLLVKIQTKQWVIEDGPYDPGGFGENLNRLFQALFTAYETGGADALSALSSSIATASIWSAP
jgi:hypothetical protein